MIATIVFGGLSDRTRTRFGRRNPWIATGGVLLGLRVTMMSFTSDFAVLVVLWVVFQIGLGGLARPGVAERRFPHGTGVLAAYFYSRGLNADNRRFVILERAGHSGCSMLDRATLWSWPCRSFANEMFEGGRNAMTFIEPQSSACTAHQWPARVAGRIPRGPGKVVARGGTMACGGEAFSTL